LVISFVFHLLTSSLLTSGYCRILRGLIE
jgi:hypothetical protein